jgi:hypothetical protein
MAFSGLLSTQFSSSAFGHLVAGRIQQLGHRAIGRAAMVCSIFMASITASAWPLVTLSPALTANDTTLPGMGAVRRPPFGMTFAGMGQQVNCRICVAPCGVNTCTVSPCTYTCTAGALAGKLQVHALRRAAEHQRAGAVSPPTPQVQAPSCR